MRWLQDQGCDHTCFRSLDPTACAHAPLLPGFKPGEIILGSGGRKVVSRSQWKAEEFFGQKDTGRVLARIFFIGLTTAVSEESGQRIPGAGPECGSKDVFLQWHASILCSCRIKPLLALFFQILIGGFNRLPFVLGSGRGSNPDFVVILDHAVFSFPKLQSRWLRSLPPGFGAFGYRGFGLSDPRSESF